MDEFYASGDPTAGNFVLTYELDPNNTGTPTSDTVAIPYNATKVTAQAAFEAHSQINTLAANQLLNPPINEADVQVIGGPWPEVALHVIWQGRYAGKAVPFPAINNSGLTGGKARMRKSSSTNWEGY